MKWGYVPVDRNPIDLVEVKRPKGIQPKKRLKEPLTRKQINDLLSDPKLPQHVRVMSILSLGLGLRASELLGLRWEDIDMRKGELNIVRGAVGRLLNFILFAHGLFQFRTGRRAFLFLPLEQRLIPLHGSR